MASMGRPAKLKKKIIEEISGALGEGLTRETAAKYARISYQTFYNWYKRGKQEFDRIEAGISSEDAGINPAEEKIYLIFFNQVEEAEVNAIVGWQQIVNKAAKIDAGHAMRMLQLRDPKGYKPAPEETISYDLAAMFANGQVTRAQIERISRGENPATVLADTGSGPATAP